LLEMSWFADNANMRMISLKIQYTMKIDKYFYTEIFKKKDKNKLYRILSMIILRFKNYVILVEKLVLIIYRIIQRIKFIESVIENYITGKKNDKQISTEVVHLEIIKKTDKKYAEIDKRMKKIIHDLNQLSSAQEKQINNILASNEQLKATILQKNENSSENK